MPHFQRLPEHIRLSPAVTDTRLSRLEDRVSKLEEKPDHSHLGHLMSHEVKTPLGSLPLPLAILAGSYLAYKNPEALLKFFGL